MVNAFSLFDTAMMKKEDLGTDFIDGTFVKHHDFDFFRTFKSKAI